MNTFKECLAEDYSKAVNKSFDIILGKLNQAGIKKTSRAFKRFPKVVETSESKNIIDTFRNI